MTALQANHSCEESGHFPAPVFEQICQLILESANVLADSGKARAGFHSLARLAKSDQNFASWLSVYIADLSQANDHALAQDWDCFLSRLIAINPPVPGFSTAQNTIIQSSASVALRLRTLERSFQQQLEQTKRNAIYQLAYGLSHELNNPLANITLRAGVLRQSANGPEEQALLDSIVDNAARGSEMLGDLMLIAQPPTFNPQPTHLESLSEAITQRCQHWAMQYGILLEAEWVWKGSARIDSAMVKEVVWTLVRNAIEASEQGQTIRLRGRQLEQQILLSVDDEGPGLSGEALQFCFDPFFSGREAGRGLGVGLTKAKRLAELHGGDVSIANLPVQGCRAEFSFRDGG